MLFTSYRFLAFLAVLLPLYYLVPRRFQWRLLLAADALFYLCAGWQGLCFMAATVLVSWAAGRMMKRSFAAQRDFLKSPEGKALDREARKAWKRTREKQRKIVFALALLVDLGILAALKYTNFLVYNLNALFSASLAGVDWVLPMGISFYTFQTVGYLIDVYWEKIEAEDSLPRVALFTSFFPLLVQGPICRFGELKETLFAPHDPDGRSIGFGAQRMLWGYFKKLVVADRLLPAITALCAEPERYSGGYAALGALLYAARLYADFTGGIDITIGVAEMLGVTVPENFRRPFFSRGIAQYWRRWHISMGTWFKDYIFYPISVSPRLLKLSKRVRARFPGLGKKLTLYWATIVTWFLTGLWHGAAWSFVVWGLLNAALILAAEEFKPLSQRFRARFPALTASFSYRLFETLRTFCMMCALRMLDCYRDVGTSFRAFGSVFTGGNWKSAFTALPPGLSGGDVVVAGLGVVLMFAVSLWQETRGSVRETLAKRAALPWAAGALLALAVLTFGAYGVGYDSTQFIYNQF
ncbi:MAG: MBOAT family protein [Oscillospiraceae bacterium]|nr:MBOAT family protein [Oscillospiraceae bacterium]